MADQNLLHTAEIMKAALPFIDSKSRVMAEFFTKILDLMGSMKSMTNKVSMSAYGNEGEKIDVEGLLNGIRPLCNNKERESVDKILNIFNAKRMFEMYNNFMSTMKTMQEYGGFPFGESGGSNDSDNTMGNFAGFNFDSIFGNNGGNNSEEPETTASEEFNYEEGFSQQEANTSDSDQDQSQSPPLGGMGGKGNNKMMFDMLKTMVPPEQMSTFENLSMLFNTMSYDSNSKPEDSEERNNG
ncbi:MAG: hypothetical protein K0S01_2898 [Herbinix sp.]|jgi:hypothetical protein|nr:hypothetical protein [Herbinix sp.]